MCRSLLRSIAIASLLVAVTSCSSQRLLINLNPETNGGHAWPMRTEFQPRGKSIRGILVQGLRPNWCKANELTWNVFPESVKRLEASVDHGLSDASFSTSGTFASGERLDVLLGVFETCQGQRGNFLLVLAPGRGSGAETVVQVEEFTGQPTFFYLERDSADRSFTTKGCFQCDDLGTTYTWDPEAGRFKADHHLKEIQEMG